MIIKNIKSLSELDTYLTSLQTKELNLINYVWLEYGFYPILFNELFLPFINQTKGKKIGLCFPGHEVFYEPHVDYLIVLENFIDTSKAYKDNNETDLLLNNFLKFKDRGVAFWFTVRNFDEDQYWSVISKYEFRNIIFPIGKEKAWENDLFILKPGYCYGSGKDGEWNLGMNKWYSTNTLGWEIETWNPTFNKKSHLNIKKYNTFFVKNSWKSRDYSSNNINDFLVGKNATDGKKGYGFVDHSFYNDVINYHINNKLEILVINDLCSFPKIESEYVHYLDMVSFFDTKLFLTVIDNSENFISTSTSPIDLSTYYCNTNLVLLDDKQNKINFVKKIQDIKKKQCMSFNVGVDDNNKLYNFLKWN
jgi:hypothetical protein